MIDWDDKAPGLYYVAQIMPDHGSREAAAVGVMLCCHKFEYIGTKVIPVGGREERRVMDFFGYKDDLELPLSRVHEIGEALLPLVVGKDRESWEAGINDYLNRSTGYGMLSYVEGRPCAVPRQAGEWLDMLYDQMVAWPRKGPG